ncbi:MAG: DUF2149 domain-containing protein, partial [Methanosarcinales archaeon]|nr:DUF2149 domain-containing protein [Methanosarcinales archaeon]
GTGLVHIECDDCEEPGNRGERVEVQKITDEDVYGMGKVLGTTFLLADGTVIYVPENTTG